MRLLALVWPDLRVPGADPSPWERMLDALDDLSPRVEAVDLGVALVDVTGLEPTWGTERRVAARAVALAREVAPLRVRCGIGENRWLASLAARLARFERPTAPAALRVLDRAELGDLSLTLLPGDAATRQRLALFGLTRMEQLAGLPRSAVGAQFGLVGERLQALARGHDPRPLVPRRRPERVEASATFEDPLDGIGAVGLTLRRLAADLCDRLAARHLAPGRAVLTLMLEDAPALRVAQPFPQPALEPDWIVRLLLSRVEAAARARTLGRGASSSPDDNQGDRMLAPARSRGADGLRNQGISRSQPLPDAGTPTSPPSTVTTIGIRQERHGTEVSRVESDDEHREPRVVSVRLVLDRLADPATRQIPAFEVQAGRWEELRWSLERIRHRFGEDRLWRASVDRPTAALPEHRSRLVDIGA
jgi:nucleotidyltransferase/DNA polymerase involved in DNA repair